MLGLASFSLLTLQFTHADISLSRLSLAANIYANYIKKNAILLK